MMFPDFGEEELLLRPAISSRVRLFERKVKEVAENPSLPFGEFQIDYCRRQIFRDVLALVEGHRRPQGEAGNAAVVPHAAQDDELEHVVEGVQGDEEVGQAAKEKEAILMMQEMQNKIEKLEQKVSQATDEKKAINDQLDHLNKKYKKVLMMLGRTNN
ncbi:hypothetical protein PMAYCL1PPCAC_14458 [Pristionchus mayeri]|uniref:Uncharacterized protein n=1 Tax=Pristionchus mayeri TaxID=1317129 RepID=A0AAN4ZSX2_9BILA|nr:hypothetical protein PMAYCL1PPCAC_14458 [Pristionchus mayeri]